MAQEHNTAELSILIVEDNPGDRDLIIEGLEEPAGMYRASCAATLRAAIAALDCQPVDVVVLDLGLPDCQGLDTFLRLHEKAPDVPVVVMTGLNDEQTAIAAIKAGAQDYLVKGRTNKGLIIRALQNAVERLRLLAQLERERLRRENEREQAVLDDFSSGGATTSVVARMHGGRPLFEVAPEAFAEHVNRHCLAIDLAMDCRVHQVDHDVSAGVRALAEEMGAMRAGPRDVIDLHKAALARACADQPEAKARVITEEGRFLLVELMGYLVSFYRPYFTERRAGRPAAADHKTNKGKFKS